MWCWILSPIYWVSTFSWPLLVFSLLELTFAFNSHGYSDIPPLACPNKVQAKACLGRFPMPIHNDGHTCHCPHIALSFTIRHHWFHMGHLLAICRSLHCCYHGVSNCLSLSLHRADNAARLEEKVIFKSEIYVGSQEAAACRGKWGRKSRDARTAEDPATCFDGDEDLDQGGANLESEWVSKE